MKLYTVPNHSYVRPLGTNNIFKFFHIDGMYSYCKDIEGNIVHLKAWTEVEVVPPPIDNNNNT